MRRLAVLLAFVLAVAACGDDDAGTPTTTEAAGTTGAGATAVPPPSGPPLLAGVDGTMTLLTPTSGEGIRPLLAWAPVSTADHYALFLYAPSGEVYWSWSGTATEVHVGGEPQLRDGASGPSVVEGMSWAVIAYDAGMLPIAASEIRPVSP
jgi:hypothetical protein